MKYKTFIYNIIKKVFGIFNLDAFAQDIYNRCRYLIDFNIQSRNARFKNQGLPDGLPAPLPQLIYLVTGQYDIESFYQNGVQGSESIKSILENNGLEINAFESILDFGCGCGRIMRHWKTLSGPKLYGSDYNPLLVNWCKKSLTFAEFKLNISCSMLDYNDDKFDFIYVISVFTHLDEQLQRFWIRELSRILNPGGYLYITVHGTTRLHQLTPRQRQAFESGQIVVVNEKDSGTNRCGTYHPEQYVRQKLCKDLTVVDFVPGGAKDANQDAFLLQKPIKSENKDL